MSASSTLADIISFPVRTAARQAGPISSNSCLAFGGWLASSVDDWGRDDCFVGRVRFLSALRWNISLGGTEHIPKRGALLIVNARRFALAPVFAALAIGAELDRPVRFLGRPDTAPLGPAMQRLGALLPNPDDLAGALRAGELVVMGAEPTFTNAQAGEVDHHLVGAAVAAGVPVIPAATVSTMTGRGARVEIGKPVRLRRRRRGPLAELELADLAHERLGQLLAQLGGEITGTPLDWFRADLLGGLR